jgi:hypothetical protein
MISIKMFVLSPLRPIERTGPTTHLGHPLILDIDGVRIGAANGG